MNVTLEYLQEYASDTYARYYLITQMLRDMFPKQTINILEVGGRGTLLNQFLSYYHISYSLTVLDPLPPNAEDKAYTYIQKTATPLDFADKAFPVVISTDVLEHVYPKDKNLFVEELLRVAKDLVILAAPFNSPIVDHAEHIANDFYKIYTKQDHLWLKEHFSEGKPEKKQIEKILRKHGYEFETFGNNSIENWLQMILLNFLPTTSLAKQSHVNAINQYFNQNLFAMNDFAEPTYRTFYVVFKNPKLARAIPFPKQSKSDITKHLHYQALVYTFFCDALRDISPAVQKRLKTDNAITKLIDENAVLTKRFLVLQGETTALGHKLASIEQTQFFRTWQFLSGLKRKVAATNPA